MVLVCALLGDGNALGNAMGHAQAPINFSFIEALPYF